MLQIRPVTLVSKPPEKRKKRALPKLVVKETVASKARRYVRWVVEFSKKFCSKIAQ